MSAQPQPQRICVVRLNPYYTGSYSMRWQRDSWNYCKPSLNPYYTGSYSMRGKKLAQQGLVIT